MRNGFSSLNENDVLQIALLVEALDKSSFDLLQLDVGDLKLTLSKGGLPVSSGAPPQLTNAAAPPSTAPEVKTQQASPIAAAAKVERRLQDGTFDVCAPIVGLFYSKPDPTAAPFVGVGAKVTKDTTVGLIEVMKVFNAVPAGADGVIIEICVEEAQFVEFDQVLFRIQPDVLS